MLKKTRSLLLQYSGAALVVASLLIAYGTLLPSEYVPRPQGLNYDKLAHFGAFTVFTGIVWLYLRHRGWKALKLDASAFAIGIAVGLSIEILQALLPINRAAEPLDMLADAAGSLLAVGLLRLLGFDSVEE